MVAMIIFTVMMMMMMPRFLISVKHSMPDQAYSKHISSNRSDVNSMRRNEVAGNESLEKKLKGFKEMF